MSGATGLPLTILRHDIASLGYVFHANVPLTYDNMAAAFAQECSATIETSKDAKMSNASPLSDLRRFQSSPYRII
jgi:hypothetical protein